MGKGASVLPLILILLLVSIGIGAIYWNESITGMEITFNNTFICSDGTLIFFCSPNKPLYCFNGDLIEKCSFCGCSFDQECRNDESCGEKTPSNPSSCLVFNITLMNSMHASCGETNYDPRVDVASPGPVDGPDCILDDWDLMVFTNNAYNSIWCTEKLNAPIVKVNCSDSDGGADYYVKGITQDGTSTNTDSCALDILNEYYCTGNSLDEIHYDCSLDNKICRDGACVDIYQSLNCSDDMTMFRRNVQGLAGLWDSNMPIRVCYNGTPTNYNPHICNGYNNIFSLSSPENSMIRNDHYSYSVTEEFDSLPPSWEYICYDYITEHNPTSVNGKLVIDTMGFAQNINSGGGACWIEKSGKNRDVYLDNASEIVLETRMKILDTQGKYAATIEIGNGVYTKEFFIWNGLVHLNWDKEFIVDTTTFHDYKFVLNSNTERLEFYYDGAFMGDTELDTVIHPPTSIIRIGNTYSICPSGNCMHSKTEWEYINYSVPGGGPTHDVCYDDLGCHNYYGSGNCDYGHCIATLSDDNSFVGACDSNPYPNSICCQQECTDGTVYGRCSSRQPNYCNDGALVTNCAVCGCPNNRKCLSDGSCDYSKDMSMYSYKEVFLISDVNWRNVLSLAPITTWTGNENCNKGYGTPDNVCVYPTLIFHEENTGSDIDSIIYFLQQYGADKLTIIGSTPPEIDNVLIAAPEFGAGLRSDQIKRINPDDYFSYWEEFGEVVYVEDNYEIALLASEYASLINVPLIIQGTNLDQDNIFLNRKTICVGNVNRACDETYDSDQLQTKYVKETQTDKIILVNPDDLNIALHNRILHMKKTPGSVSVLYSKTSLAAPFLAGAKHQLIIPIADTDQTNIKNNLRLRINGLVPYIINNQSGIIKRGDFIRSQSNIRLFDLSTQNTTNLTADDDIQECPAIYGNKVIWKNSQTLHIYDMATRQETTHSLDPGHTFSSRFCPKIYDNVVAWVGIDNSSFGAYTYDLISQQETKIMSDVNELDIHGEIIVGIKLKFVGNTIVNKDVHIYNLTSHIESKLTDNNHSLSISIYGDSVVWMDAGNAYLHNITTKQTKIINDLAHIFGELKIYGNNIFYRNSYSDRRFFIYDLITRQKQETNVFVALGYNIHQEKVVSGSTICDLTKNGQRYGCLRTDVGETIKFISMTDPDNYGDIIVYINIDDIYNYYYIYGFLTVLGAPNAIPIKEHNTIKAADHTYYADLNMDDSLPDISSGRIMGITVSDVSSYIARDLFFDNFQKSNNVKFLASSFPGSNSRADIYATLFNNAGYNAIALTSPNVNHNFDPLEWENQDLIWYDNHGSSNWAGIFSDQIPLLRNSMVITKACSTCSTYEVDSVCTNAIRQGAIGYIGSVAVTLYDNDLFQKALARIYSDKLTLGEAITIIYTESYDGFTTILIGDPTLNIDPPHYMVVI
jgi:hypothetical protein